MTMLRAVCVLLGVAMLLAVQGAAHAEAPATIIVLDGSGSMRGKIGGRAKHEIARETVMDVLQRFPQGRALGLMAYGHRTKGECGDIELMVPPAKGSAAAIGEAVKGMRFLGMTPLSEAVRQAAAALRHTEQAATVVLVTDGLETCRADPCAVGAELEASGVDFTAHVIGFGLTAAEGAKVACLAEKTGGRYIAAGDRKALAEALQEAVAEPSPAVAPARRTYHPGRPLMPDVALEPTGGTTGDTAEAPPQVTFPPTGTIAQCAKVCEDQTLCAAWRYEPKGSHFIDDARCFTFGAATEFDWKTYDPAEGWASGIKDGARLLIRPYPEP
ncbi:VWA domain-containing protein [Enterovirga rhinocerotis]